MVQRLKGHGHYYVYWRIFSPQQVGIPHNRPRVFIIGFLASTRAAHHFKWPKLGSCQVVGLQSFFAKNKKDQEAVAPNPRIGTRSAKSLDAACKELQKHGASPVQEPYVIDCCHGKRFMSVEEILQLQGFPRDFAEKARAKAITPRSLAGMVGSAVSVDL